MANVLRWTMKYCSQHNESHLNRCDMVSDEKGEWIKYTDAKPNFDELERIREATRWRTGKETPDHKEQYDWESFDGVVKYKSGTKIRKRIYWDHSSKKWMIGIKDEVIFWRIIEKPPTEERS